MLDGHKTCLVGILNRWTPWWLQLCGICRSDTAMLYNDRAVLENHHVSAAYRLLQDDDEMNILLNLSKDDWRWEETVSTFYIFTDYRTNEDQMMKGVDRLWEDFRLEIHLQKTNVGTNTWPRTSQNIWSIFSSITLLQLPRLLTVWYFKAMHPCARNTLIPIVISNSSSHSKQLIRWIAATFWTGVLPPI